MPLIFQISRSEGSLNQRGTLQIYSEPTEIVMRGRDRTSQLMFPLDDRSLETLSEVFSGIVRKIKKAREAK